MRTRTSAVVIGFITFLLTGCATFTSGSIEKLSVKSNPEGAKVTIANSKAEVLVDSVTPISVSLNRGNGYFNPGTYLISVAKDGYIERNLLLKSHLNSGWYILGNVFSGNWVGWFVVDPMTGAMWQLDSNNVLVDLKESDTSTTLNNKRFEIEDIPRPKVQYNPWVAGIAGLLFPGAGHYYQEKWGTGTLFLGSSFLLGMTAFSLGYAGQEKNPWFRGVYGAWISVSLFSAVDAVRLALDSDK